MKKLDKLLALLLLPFAAVAQQPQLITLEQCRAMAVEHSLHLQSSVEKIAAAEDMLKAYKTNFLPNFSLSGGYLYSTTKLSQTIEGGYLPTFSPDPTTGQLQPNVIGFGADGSPIFSSYAYMPDMNFELEVGSLLSAGIQVAQPIYMGGKITTATRLAQLGVDVAKIEQQRSHTQVIVEADEAFYTYLKVGEMVESANAYRTVVDEFYRQVSKSLEGGMCTKNDLMKVQVKVNEAQLNQLKANNGLALARMNLCYILGLPLSTKELEVVDNFTASKAIDPTLDVTARPEYELLAKSVEAKQLQVKLAQSDFLPSVSAVASYNYMYGAKFNGETLMNSAPNFTGGVTVNIPLFHWGEGRRKVSAARHEVVMAQNSQADLVQKMTLELMQSINRYQEAEAEVALMKRTLTQTEENLRQSRKQYEAGMETISNYLEAQAIWQKAMSDLVEAKSNQRIAFVRYCRTRGIAL